MSFTSAYINVTTVTVKMLTFVTPQQKTLLMKPSKVLCLLVGSWLVGWSELT